MKVKKELCITPQEFFEVIEKAMKPYESNVYEGLTYRVKDTEIKVLEYDEISVYKARIKRKDILEICYKIEGVHEETGACEISYEENFIGVSKVTRFFHKIMQIFFKKRKKKRMEAKLKQIESEVLSEV